MLDISQYANWLNFLIIAVPIFLGFCKWLHSVYTEIKKIRKELTPNGGSSLRDAIDRVESRIESVEFAQHIGWDFHEVAIFQTNSRGDFVWANQTYLNLIGRSKEYTLGRGWESSVHHEDREMVASEWDNACLDGRNFDMTYRLVDINQNVIRCRVRAYGSKKTGYIGFVYRLDENLTKTSDLP